MITADRVVVGNRHLCILLAGKISCFGANVAGNLGIGGTNSQDYPVAVDETTGLPATVDAIGVGYDLTCALGGGSVWCWGAENAQQTGNRTVPRAICNSNYCHDKPVEVEAVAADGGVSQSFLTGVTAIRIGYQFGCAVDGAGAMRCWGANASGSDGQATPFTNTNPSAPSGPITLLSAWGEDSRSAPRYLTTSGTYVMGNQIVTPICP
jgi:alpha-tubulin suppressor-like RCC1 family protein